MFLFSNSSTKFQTSSVNCEFYHFSDVILGPPAATQPNNQPSFFTMELHWARPGDGWKEVLCMQTQINVFTNKLLYNGLGWTLDKVMDERVLCMQNQINFRIRTRLLQILLCWCFHSNISFTEMGRRESIGFHNL